jgi:protein-disulfide isomerase
VSDPTLISLPVEGNPDSDIRVISFEDLQCRDSAAWRRMLDDVLLPRFADTVAFESRDFPIDRHHWAKPAAVVCRRLMAVSAAQGLDFRRYCYEHIERISAESFPENVAAYAEAAGLDSEDISISVRNPDFQRAVEIDIAEARRLRVVRTPTIILGDVRFIEIFGVEEVIAAIDKALRS